MLFMKGFTLIEFLIYIGIVAIVLLSANAIALNVIFGKVKLSTIEEVNQNARFSMVKIASTISNAETINNPATSTQAASLSLKMADTAKDPTVFDVSGGILRIQEGTGAAVNLISDEVTVADIQFFNISYLDTPGTVRIQMTIKASTTSTRQEYIFEKTFYTTANIRKK